MTVASFDPDRRQVVLVAGGAGYIGAHACKLLARAGYLPVTYDNLATGWAQAVKFGPFEQGDILDRARLDAVFAKWQPVAVMHFAALSQVGEAVQSPGRFWRVNVGGSLNVIEAALAVGCRNLIFSSTCAIYGDQDGVLLHEDSPQAPLNAYGASKRAIEDMLRDFTVSDGLRPVIFRYFNVAGADPEAEVGECHTPETHLVPLLLQAVMGKRDALTLHGTDYPTPDGTCIRDYVHVMDIAAAHVLGVQRLLSMGEGGVFCLGTGTGFSVRDVVKHARMITNAEVPVIKGPRRAGDAVSLVCGSEKARAELGWNPSQSTLDVMLRDAWRWHQSPGFGV